MTSPLSWAVNSLFYSFLPAISTVKQDILSVLRVKDALFSLKPNKKDADVVFGKTL